MSDLQGLRSGHNLRTVLVALNLVDFTEYVISDSVYSRQQTELKSELDTITLLLIFHMGVI